MVDPDRVRRLLGQLEEFRARLADLRDLPRDHYVAEKAFEGRYLVQAAAQLCIDVANHAIASEGWRVPADFGDAFAVLQDQGVLDTELAARLQDLAGLRDLLVHAYADIDDARIHAALQDGLQDLSRFAQAVAVLTADD